MNRRLFGVRAQVRGRRLERLIAELNRRGVRICDMRRGSLRALDFCIRRRDVKALRAACGALDVTVESLTPLGADGALAFLKRRMALPVSAAACVLIIGLIGARVWRVEVDAPTAELRAQVEYALGELGARPGAMKSALDLKSIESAITSGVEGVKFCQARVRGVVFTLTAQQVSPAPDVLSLTPAGGLYARCDAVVERVQVLSGRAVVKRGDTVRAGDLLIAGEERVSNDDSSVPVRAIGVVTGRVWYEGRAEINLSDIELKRTGRESIRRVIRLWDYEFDISKGEEFALCDREITRQMIGGLFLPLCVESVRTYEVTETNIQRDIAEAKALTGENARQNAVKKCPDNAFVIDKWTEYSIIEGDTIEARYVIEAEETIQCGG
jgi:similar to stage IV sporulation protein